jgi:hypothetical protein
LIKPRFAIIMEKMTIGFAVRAAIRLKTEIKVENIIIYPLRHTLKYNLQRKLQKSGGALIRRSFFFTFFHVVSLPFFVPLYYTTCLTSGVQFKTRPLQLEYNRMQIYTHKYMARAILCYAGRTCAIYITINILYNIEAIYYETNYLQYFDFCIMHFICRLRHQA